MAKKYTKEQLNRLDKETIIQMFLSQQEYLKNIDSTFQLGSKIPDLKRHRFESSSKRHETEDQISFMEVNENIAFFNESEAVYAEKTTEDPKVISRRKARKNRRSC